jgi:hypothetical protein
MVTGIPSVLFHESLNSFRRVQAFVTLVECILLWLDNNLTFHPLVAKTTGMAALERIRPRSFGNELNHGRFTLLELPAFLPRCEN